MTAGYLTVLLDHAPSIEALTGVLAHQQRLLERLLFRLNEVALLLAAGEHRFLVRAVDEAEEIEQQLGEADMVRALVVQGLGERWGVPESEMTLEAIIQRAAEGPGRRLTDIKDEMRELVDQIEAVRRDGLTLAAMRSERSEQTLAAQGS